MKIFWNSDFFKIVQFGIFSDTEIDWSTYMQQVECYVKKGTMNYTKIGGDTGPVVLVFNWKNSLFKNLNFRKKNFLLVKNLGKNSENQKTLNLFFP